MFREMRRKKQMLSSDACIAVLKRGTSGTLAVLGDDHYPYAVPLSYVYHDNKLIFHSATTGHKLDGICNHDKVSFCVIDEDNVIPEEYTTEYRSVIVFGKARILEHPEEKRAALLLLSQRYTPNHSEQQHMQVIDRALSAVCMFEVAIQHMSGKASHKLL